MKPEKISFQDLNDKLTVRINNNHPFPLNYLIEDSSNSFDFNLRLHVREGLKRKGYEFDNDLEMEKFIKNNCHCFSGTHQNIDIYSIGKDNPFLQVNHVKITEIKDYTAKGVLKTTFVYK